MRGCRIFGRDATQGSQAGGVRSGEQFVQRWMDARPHDLRKAKGGEAEQARVERIVRQRGRRARDGITDRFTARCAVVLPCPTAIAPPESTSIATSAGVG